MSDKIHNERTYMNRFQISTVVIVLALPLLFFTDGCGVSRQVNQVKNLSNCDFQIHSVENLNLAGISIQNVNSVSDLGLADFGRIMAAMILPVFPLSMTLNIVGRNPNTKPAGLNKLDWILFIDDIQMTSGSLDQAFVIPPNQGTAVIPVQITVDLKKVLNGRSADALVNFGLNLKGKGGTPTRFMIKLKPTIMTGKTPLTYPGYITVRTEYSSQ